MDNHFSDDHNEQVIRLYFKYLAQMDLDGWLDLIADRVRQLMPFAPRGFSKLVEGRTGLYQHYRRLLKDQKWSRLPISAVFATQVPGVYLVEFTLIAKQQSGKLYMNKHIARFTLVDGLIQEIVEYYNPIPLLESLDDQDELRINFNLN
jgi:ketosteroid isomerase-like protein